jgi:hypothetical protein
MPRFTVHVELTFEDIEAPTLDKACGLGEIWCGPVWRGPDAKADAIRSYGERCQDGQEKASKEAEGVEQVRSARPSARQGAERGRPEGEA